MDNVIQFTGRKPPSETRYTVHFTHHTDGGLEVWFEDVGDNEDDRKALAWAMAQGAVMMLERL